MQGTVDGFSHGLVTPVVAYVMACLGGALGLRCTTRSQLARRSRRSGWLALGATAIGSGIWTMHFIAMMGFSVKESPVHYDKLTTFASLGVAVLMVGIGIFIVGHRGATGTALFTAGAITGLGIASMHYLGMAGMRLNGKLEYNTVTVSASVVIAVVAATAALWAAAQVRGFLWSVGASLVMGLAVSGMHYTGMAALSVHLHNTVDTPAGDSPAALLAPLMIGPLVFLFLAGVVVMFDPMVLSNTDRGRAKREKDAGTGADTVPDPGLRPPFRSTQQSRDPGSRTPQRW